MSGNLELILENKTLYAFTEDPDCHVHNALVSFAKHKHRYERWENVDYEGWFIKIANRMHMETNERLTHPVDRLVIDVPRRVIEYTETFSPPRGFVEAKRKLADRYRIQVHKSGEFPLREG